MKIAFVTDDGKTICRHFGRAQYYLVVEIENDKEKGRTLREKMGHQHFSAADTASVNNNEPHGFDPASQKKHLQMFEAISDCEVLVAGGMGRGAYQSMQESGMKVFVVSLEDIDQALESYIAGNLEDLADLVH